MSGGKTWFGMTVWPSKQAMENHGGYGPYRSSDGKIKFRTPYTKQNLNQNPYENELKRVKANKKEEKKEEKERAKEMKNVARKQKLIQLEVERLRKEQAAKNKKAAKERAAEAAKAAKEAKEQAVKTAKEEKKRSAEAAKAAKERKAQQNRNASRHFEERVKEAQKQKKQNEKEERNRLREFQREESVKERHNRLFAQELARVKKEKNQNNKLRNEGKYRSSDGKIYDLQKLQTLKARYRLTSLNAAATRYKALRNKVPQKGSDGWGTNIRNSALPEVYYKWLGGRHEKITKEEMNEAGGNSEKALKLRKTGWNTQKTAFGLLNGNRVARVKAPNIARVKSRLAVFRKRPATNEEAARIFLQHKKRNDGGGYFDYYRNRYVGAGGNFIPGNTFATGYANRRRTLRNELVKKRGKNGIASISSSSNNNDNNNYSTNPRNKIAKYVATQHGKKFLIKSARALELPRRAIDAELIAELNRTLQNATNGSYGTKIARWLCRVFSIGGSDLEKRPLLTGNVGIPLDTRSPKQQIDEQVGGDGCIQLKKQWGSRQGESLMIHQSVVYTMANLRAMGILRTGGLLALHSTGAGKTLSGVACIVAFWNTPGMAIIPCSVRSNQSGNNILKLAELASRYFPWFHSTVDSDSIPTYPFAAGEENARKALVARLQLGHSWLAKNPRHTVSPEHLLGTMTTVHRDLFGYNGRPGYFQASKTAPRRSLENCVFILDEIQMLVSPPKQEIAMKDLFMEMIEIFKNGRDLESTWVLGMTATPGETSPQVAEVLRMIAGRDDGLDTPKSIRDDAQGIISYAYTQGDTTKFAKIEVKHECIPINKCGDREHAFYSTIYYSQLQKLEETQNIMVRSLMIEKAPRMLKAPIPKNRTVSPHLTYNVDKKFSLYSRVSRVAEYSKVTHGTHLVEFDEGENNNMDGNKGTAVNFNNVDGGIQQYLEDLGKKATGPVVMASYRGDQGTRRQQALQGNNTPKLPKPHFFVLSPKITGVIKSILSEGGVHFVYSRETETLRLIAHVLERYGFSLYPARKHKAERREKKPRFCFLNTMENTKRKRQFWTGKEFKRAYKISQSDINTLFSLDDEGDSGEGQKEDAKPGVLRDPQNKDGEYCKVVLATGATYKGVDIAHIRHIHAVSMLPDFIDIIQLVGRGPRNCGHRGLPLKQRKVTFHMWKFIDTRHSGNILTRLSPDKFLFDRALQVYLKGYGKLERAIMDVSVDSLLFERYNKSAEITRNEIIKGCQATNKNQKLTLPNRLAPPPKPKPTKAIKKRRTQRSILEKRRNVYRRKGMTANANLLNQRAKLKLKQNTN